MYDSNISSIFMHFIFVFPRIKIIGGAGEQIYVDVQTGFGGAGAEYGMDVSVGTFDGKWLMFSLEGKIIPQGFYQLTTLVTDSLAGLNCQQGSFGLIGCVVSDIFVSFTYKYYKRGSLRVGSIR